MLGFVACSQSSTTSDESSSSTSAASEAETSPTASNSSPGTNTTQAVTGTFVSVEMGDYMHFNMKSDAGEELSFFVMDLPADQISPFEQPGMEGQRVEVQWRRVVQDIPEAGGEMEIDEVTQIKIIE